MGDAGLAGHWPNDQVGDDGLPGFQCPSGEVEVRAVRQRLPERLAGVEEWLACRVEQDHAVPVRVLVARENGAIVKRGQVVCGQRIGRGQPIERREVHRCFAVNRQGERLGGRAEALLHAVARSVASHAASVAPRTSMGRSVTRTRARRCRRSGIAGKRKEKDGHVVPA